MWYRVNFRYENDLNQNVFEECGKQQICTLYSNFYKWKSIVPKILGGNYGYIRVIPGVLHLTKNS